MGVGLEQHFWGVERQACHAWLFCIFTGAPQRPRTAAQHGSAM